MDSGLKERLVGAAVLVILGIWLFPWVLDGPDRESSVESVGTDELSLPAADADATVPTRTETIALAGTAAHTPPVSDAAGTQTDPVTQVRTTAGDVKPADDVGTHSVIEPRPVADSGPKAGASTADAPIADVSKAATVHGASAATTAPDHGWVVQIGSFGDVSNAERLSARASDLGYSAMVTPYPSGGRTLHRVRVGPWQTRDEAEEVASSLGAQGFVAQVVGVD